MTKRQREVLSFIAEHTERSGFPPSIRDIGDRFGLNPSTVHGHITALERKGHIRRRPNQSRSLVLVGPSSHGADSITGFDVPVVGRVAAGPPMLAEENIEETIRLPVGWVPAGCFFLQVEGDSMKDAHILDGDYVLVRPTKTATNGDIVVVLLEDEATVKRFYRRKDHIELRPENSTYEPIEVRPSEEMRFELVGKVAGVLRI